MELGLRIRWRRQADTSVSWSVLECAPSENRGFVEARRYQFTNPGSDWRLFIDDEPLQADPADPSCWLWEPGFFAGEVTGELVSSDSSSRLLYLLDVSPEPTKVGREIFAHMMAELWAEDPSLVIGCEPAAYAIGNLGTTEDPWLAFARLRRYGPGFLQAIALMTKRPRRSLRVRRDSVSLQNVRRVDKHTAASLLRNPVLAHALGETGEPEFVRPSDRLDVPVLEETVDCAANRAMLALLLALIRRNASVSDELQTQVSREVLSDTRTALAARWPARKRFLEGFGSQLKRVLRASPFPHVRRSEITAAGLTSITTDPLYSRAWGQGWRALRHGLEAGATAERLWMSPTWELYERWCFVKVGHLLTAAAPGHAWRRLASPHKWVGTQGDHRVTLQLQPTFPAQTESVQRRWSISRERVPDLVLTIERGTETRFVVLDAKYRSSRANVLDAMASAHIYQDSLRIEACRPYATLLIVPSPGGAAWLEDPKFHREQRVGVHALAPGETSSLPAIVVEAVT